MLSDASVVRVLLPLVSALQLGGWFYEHGVCYAPPREIDENELSDEDRLRIVDEELPDNQSITKLQRASLLEKLKSK